MKYVCLVYLDEKTPLGISDHECFACGEGLKSRGVLVAAEALQRTETASTVRIRQGKLSVVDGPFA